MIDISNLSVFVNDGRHKKKILDEVSLRFPDKGFYCIYGKSGSGKTTLFNVLLANISKTSGKVCLYDKDYDLLTDDDLSIIRQNIISNVSQEATLFNNMKLIENINLYIKFLKIDDCDYSEYSRLLGLDTLMNTKIKELSGGEKQRVSILLALIKNTRIIVLDEPTSSLDYANSVIIAKALKEISKDKLVLVSTHDTALFDEYNDGFVKLSEGKIIENNVTFGNETNISYSVNKSKGNIFDFIKATFKVLNINIILKIIYIAILSFVFVFFLKTQYDVSKNDDFYAKRQYSALNKVDSDILVIKNNDFGFVDANSLEIGESQNKCILYESSYPLYIGDIDDLKGNMETALANSAYVDNTLEDDLIIFTDYMVEVLEKRGYSLSNEIAINGYEYNVAIIETNYENYLSISEEDDWYFTYNFKAIRLNQKTFDRLYESKRQIRQIILNEKDVKVVSFNDAKEYCNAYKDTLDGKEIYISTRLFEELVGGDYTELPVEVQININGKNYQFTVVGKLDLSDRICFSDYMMKELSNEFGDVLGSKFLSVTKGNEKDFVALKREAKENNLNIYFLDKEPLLAGMGTSGSEYSLLSYSLLIVSLGLTFGLIFILNKRKVGILLEYGVNMKKISLMFLIYTLVDIVISCFIALIMLTSTISETNKRNEIRELTRIGMMTEPYYYTYTLSIFSIVTIMIAIISFFIIYLYIKKVKAKKLLFSY